MKSGYFLPVCFLFLGCVLSFDEVTSRTFSSLQSACRHSCDMHKVLQEATERFRVRHCDLLARSGCQFSCAEQTNPDCQTVSTREPQRSWSSKKLQPFIYTMNLKSLCAVISSSQMCEHKEHSSHINMSAGISSSFIHKIEQMFV